MSKDQNPKAIYPKDSAPYYKEWGFSPAIECNGFVFVSGCTGTKNNGTVPEGITLQTEEAFGKIKVALNEAGLSFNDIVEITTYHVELKRHLDEFITAKAKYIAEPHPAWTAIGVTELASEGAIVEIRVIAKSKTA